MAKIIEGQHFKCNSEYSDKFITSAALGLSWRPGQDSVEYQIKNCTIDGSLGGEGLKISFCYNVYVEGCTIIGGVEDCVDIVRGGDITFCDCKFISNNTKQHITVKGGAKNINFINCTFVGDYSCWWDGAFIDLGNWTDYDDVNRPRVRNVKIEGCKIEDSKRRVLSRVLYSERPDVKNSSGSVFKVPSLFLAIFWLGQRLGLLGKRRRMPTKDLEIWDIEL
tara:strand:- start:13187 stop:13852 length:666 start_codon:yes stop_codon:yes gene_type:complete